MTAAAEVATFRQVLATTLGWSFDDNDVGQLAQVLTRRTGATRLGAAAYLSRLRAGDWATELTELAEQLTINETYFFRHGEQFRALAEAALPERIRDRAAQRVLRMLSVGCSSGEEAYTLAIVGLQAAVGPDWIVSVLGLDASPAVLERANTARYSAWSLRETPDAVRQRWFRHTDGHYELDPRVRGSVQFRLCNVAVDDASLWRPGQYDVVFCRNLLMYLTPEVQAALVGRMTRALTPGGFLFLGHTDSLGSRPEGLEPQHTHGTFYYRRTGAATPAPRPEPARSAYPAGPTTAAAPPVTGFGTPASAAPGASAGPGAGTGTGWGTGAGSVTGPGQGTGSGTGTGAGTGSGAGAGTGTGTGTGVGTAAGEERRGSSRAAGEAAYDRALTLLRDEQFAEALIVLETAPPGRPTPRELLLYGVLLAQAGRLAEAEACSRSLIDTGGLYADAHHLLGMCTEGGSDLGGAAEHYRLAAYLDPEFAMPRLRLGLLARRRGDNRVAGPELERALGLLRQEREDRIVLFGGGFGRIALTTLCRAELDATGARR